MSERMTEQLLMGGQSHTTSARGVRQIVGLELGFQMIGQRGVAREISAGLNLRLKMIYSYGQNIKHKPI